MPHLITVPLKKDADEIYSLIKPYADKNIVLSRSRDDIADSIEHFLVARKESRIIGVISFYDYDNFLIEIRSLSVKEDFKLQGTGSGLLREMIGRINKFKKNKIFALSYTPAFFLKNGFIAVDKDTLPEKIWKDCSKCPLRDNCGETALVYSY